ncbi:A/G-specific adenine glycosylase [Methyloligella sp. 2.7D]|uniref:A/G-specific adenine glycosylase n=1 Tax=unclassified Methyloligella TaxID=2625955 RepID=UPI00157DAE11|nr:A/G-specific adenine glycosylase [Methyloligella sp. GL2]QKP78308.1 A/G-specific adenine glycosylase [Methyloligella sp. GL2]
MGAALGENTKAEIARLLLDWYEREGRSLPWRVPPGGGAADPYKVWLSEVMLQQTTVKAVLPRYGRFLARWPAVTDLAAAPIEDVLAEWAGLGYYARARNLHACAVRVAEDHGGVFPDTEEGLRALPGIGGYTSAAIAAIAFGRRASPIDGNIERVVARLFALETPLPKAKPEIKFLAESLTPDSRAGDFAQAMMDLGSGICTPKRPACGLCPLRGCCVGYAAGIAAELPYKAVKAERPTRRGTAFLLVREDGAVLLRTRPMRGLLGGMLEVPSTPWEEERPSAPEGLAPADIAWRKLAGQVAHTFTHFHLELEVLYAEAPADIALSAAAEPERCRWVALRDLPDAALPSVMRKVIAHGNSDGNADGGKPRKRKAPSSSAAAELI